MSGLSECLLLISNDYDYYWYDHCEKQTICVGLLPYLAWNWVVLWTVWCEACLLCVCSSLFPSSIRTDPVKMHFSCKIHFISCCSSHLLSLFDGTKACIIMLHHQRLIQSNIPLMGWHALQNHMQITFLFNSVLQNVMKGNWAVACCKSYFLHKIWANSHPPPLHCATLVAIAFNKSWLHMPLRTHKVAL